MLRRITKSSLTLRYAIALCAICLFAGFGYFVQVYALVEYQRSQDLVDNLSRQRMAVQNISFLVQRVAYMSDRSEMPWIEKELEQGIVKLDTSLKEFDQSLGGERKSPFPRWMDSSTSRSATRALEIRERLEVFRDDAEAYLDLMEQNRPLVTRARQITDDAMIEIGVKQDSLLYSALQEMNVRLALFKDVELAIFLLIVTCIVASWLLIFRPMVNAVIDYQNNLRVTRDDIGQKVRELAEAKAKAEEANAAKTDFLANMSHEIRTPMGSIMGYAERLLATDLMPDERLRYAHVIRRNGKILLDLIDDLLDISKIEAGQLEVERIRVPLQQLTSEVHSLLGWRAREKGLEFDVRFESVPTLIESDPTRLRQVLINIVGNAIKFTEKGRIELLIRSRVNPEGRTLLEFVVSDTGVGVDPERADMLFEPFVQADNTTTRRFGGTGLGLALSRRLARALGGDLFLAQSRKGLGSTFIASIDPGAMTNETITGTLEVEEAVKKPRREEAIFPQSGLEKCHILIVDDGEENRDLFRYYLETAGAKVTEAVDGVDGVDRALEGTFDLVLMDIQMPRLDGYQALQMLKDAGYRPPIVALTAHAMKGEREKCKRAGFADHIAKPVDARTLVRNVREILKLEETAELVNETSESPLGERQGAEGDVGKGWLAIELPFEGEVPDIIKQTICRFVQSLPERVQEIETAYESQDQDRLGKLLHKIKGSAGACGFMDLMRTVAEFEDDLDSHALDVVQARHVETLHKIVEESRDWTLEAAREK